jgi:hypothetical protein
MSAYIVWHNDDTQETQIWFMNGTQISRRATVVDEIGQPIFVGPPFRIVATVRSNIIFHNDVTNETQIWFMDNGRISRRATVVDENGDPIFVGLPFRIVGAAIMSSDPLPPSSIIWHHDTSGETQTWFMSDADLAPHGERIASRATVLFENGDPALVRLPFHIVGTYLGQIFWYNDDTAETQIWEMFPDLGTKRIVKRKTVQDEKGDPIFIRPPFRIVGVADFNADPLHSTLSGDIIWHHDITHETQIWIMNEDKQRILTRATVQDETGKPIFVGPPFRIVASGNELDDQ